MANNILPQIKKSRASHLETMLKKESKSRLTVMNDIPGSPSLKYEKFPYEDKDKDKKKKKRTRSVASLVTTILGCSSNHHCYKPGIDLPAVQWPCFGTLLLHSVTVRPHFTQ
jgi:hypothetical protein